MAWNQIIGLLYMQYELINMKSGDARPRRQPVTGRYFDTYTLYALW